MSDKQYRLVTRSDLDGLISSVLLEELGIINEIKFVHPKDVQDGLVEFTENDITANIPYNPNVHICFDHHLSESMRVDSSKVTNYVIDVEAPSAARVVYNYYGGKAKFPHISEDMMIAVDKSDSARFDMEDVLNPTGWTLLSFLTDPRTGLGRFRDFRISNYALMLELTKLCRTQGIDQIMANPDVAERVEVYNKYAELAKEQVKKCSKVYNNVVVFDPRNEEQIYPTNRFMIYALFPEVNISVHVLWGLKQQNTVLAMGKSIFDRSSKTNIGELALKYGGGGHMAAGTCQVDNDKYETVLAEVIKQMNADG